MLSRASRPRERPLPCRYLPERLPRNRGTKQPRRWRAGFRVFKNECGGVSSPDLQLREDHAARCGRRSVAAARLRSRRRTSFAASNSTGSRQALADGAPITVACTQEAPLFREVAENSPQAQLTFVNIRETGGWSNDAAAAGPKAAALIAAAGEDMPPISLVTLESSGVALIYGRDEIAIEAAQRLADRLDITVLLTRPGDVTPRRTNEFPVLKGTIRNARGHLGAVRACDRRLRAAAPSSRAKLVFGPSRDGATSTCDLILDLSRRHAAVSRA